MRVPPEAQYVLIRLVAEFVEKFTGGVHHIKDVTVQHVIVAVRRWTTELEPEANRHSRCCSPYGVGGLDVRKRWVEDEEKDGGLMEE